MSAAAGKEIRVFGLGPTLVRRHRAEADTVIAAQHRARCRGALVQFLGQAVFTAGYVGAITLVAARAIAGAASAGDVVVVASLAGQVGGLVAESAGALSGSLGILQVVARLRWLERYAARQVGRADPQVAAPVRLV